jgi:iron complex outermembrane receptor protein
VRALGAMLGMASVLTLGLTLGAAHAQTAEVADATDLEVEGTARRPIPAGSELDPTAAATSIDARHRPRALETLDELILEVPGAITRRSGSAGAFSGLGLRGAGAEHTTVLLGSVPLMSPDGSAFDLSTMPVWVLDRVDVYRGGAPVWLGSGGIGGVLHLIPRAASGSGFELSGGVGSFGLYEGRASAFVRDGELSMLAAAGATSSSGRYPYRDDNRTALDPTDDRDRLRLGAENTDANFALHLQTRIERTHVELAAMGLERIGGLNGLPARRSDDPQGNRARSRYVAGLTLGWLDDDRPWARADEGDLHAEITGAVSLERRRVNDPFAEFGLVPRDTDDVLLRGYGRAAVRGRIVPELALAAVGTYAHESVALSDRLAPTAPAASRDVGTLAAEAQLDLRIDDTRLEIRGSGRVELASAGTEAIERERPLTILPTVRLAAALAPLPWLAIQASFSTAGRLPTVVELFGDRAFLVGNPGLRPEQSLGGDLGFVANGSTEDDAVRGEAELRGFANVIDNLVVYRRSEASQIVPENRASARVLGLEARVSGEILQLFELMAALTLLDARDGSTERILPLRPPATLAARAGVHLAPGAPISSLRAFVDLEYVASTFADSANLVALPERARIGLGVILEVMARVEVSLTIRDVFDARGLDLLGAPLPGRSVALSLTLR